MSHGYAITNALAGLAASAFTWSSGYATDRDRLNDGLQDELAASGAAAGASPQRLVIDMGSATSLSAFALLGHNLATGGCSVTVEAADLLDWITGYVVAKSPSAVPTSAPNDRDLVLQFPAVSRRYWRISFYFTGTKLVTLGELLAFASVTSLTRSRIYGHGETERYITNRNESPTGSVRATLLSGPVRTKRFSFKDLQGTSQRNELMSMWRATRGGVLPLLWIDTVDSTADGASEAAQECLWGRLSESHGWAEPDFLLFDVDGFELQGQAREVL